MKRQRARKLTSLKLEAKFAFTPKLLEMPFSGASVRVYFRGCCRNASDWNLEQSKFGYTLQPSTYLTKDNAMS
jgi:hypothetical protein